MSLKRLRKPILAATLALLAIPGVALAGDDIDADEPYARYAGAEQAPYISQAECFYLEMNIPGYDCAEPLGRFAGQPDLPEKPDGVDYKFWEDNVWEFQGADDEGAGGTPPDDRGSAKRPSDRGFI
jgi:hypothetical protein